MAYASYDCNNTEKDYMRQGDKRPAVVGIVGGEEELRKIMNSTGELTVVDRGILSVHLGIQK